jgi:uncharacterized protein
MVQVTFPGVYIEEVSSGVHTITGVATSIGAFLGRTSRGPLNEPVRILSLADFSRQFGGAHPHSDLPDAVTQFFVNGGTDCYVVRLAKGALKAAVTLKDLKGEKALDAVAKAEGVWANTVRLMVDYKTANPDDSFNLTVIQEEGGRAVASETFTGLSMDPTDQRYAPTYVSQNSDLIDLHLGADLLAPATSEPPTGSSFINQLANSAAGFSQGRRPLGANAADVRNALTALLGAAQSKFNISANSGPVATVDLTGVDLTGTLANIETKLAARINTFLATASPGTTITVSLTNVAGVGILPKIQSNSGDQSRVEVTRAGANDIAAALMLGVDQGGVEFTRFSNFRPAPTASILTLGPVATAGSLDNLNTLAPVTQSSITALTLDALPAIGLTAGDANLVTTAGGDPWFKNKAGTSTVTGDNDGVREKLGIIAGAINAQATLPYRAEVWGYHLAVMPKAGVFNPLTPNSLPTTYQTGVVGFDNALVNNVYEYTLGTGGTSAFSTGGADGNDGTAPTEVEYLGDPLKKTGLYALEPVDLFNLMVLPPDDEVSEATMGKVWGPASNYCATRRAFLVIDAPPSWTKNGLPEVVNKTSLINDLRVTVNKENSAVFYPRIRYSRAGVTRLTGPGGAIAGLMSRTDSTRGVWKAPAGLEADVRNILGLEVVLTDMENGVLNKLGANSLRLFPNGIVSWGARTLAGSDDLGSEWKYIPIRRFAIFLEESLYRGTKWVVFEPNDEPLWSKIRLNLNAFMMGLFRQGAFQGTTPDKAFFVKCDAETTTQNDRNLGIVNIIVGFAPLKPAEFVIIKIQQIAGDLG